MLDYLIIDPASTEFNRGSFCYLPYILHNALSERGYSVRIIENFTVADMDTLPQASKTLVSLWSYPQIEACQVLHKLHEYPCRFFGYTPLIEKLGLPVRHVADFEVLEGIRSYPKYYNKFKYLLLSDCDMHLSEYEGIVYPLFTSYGCPRSCSFCPSSVNCKQTRLELETGVVINMLAKCREIGVMNIHFTDEDFFWDRDRAYTILLNVIGRGMKFIALGSVQKVQKFIDKYGEKVLIDSGMKLIEVGFETADPELAKTMHKPSVNSYVQLAKSLKEVQILWLTLSFFPGETITTLNKTGDFLKSFGLDYNKLYGRIRTNGTRGGLGQFFQLYDGVKDHDTIEGAGEVLTERPMRLMPSFIPNSFKESKVWGYDTLTNVGELRYFVNLYKVEYDHLEFSYGKKIKDIAKTTDDYVALAIMARLGVIR